jgi:hypothetical protein
VGLIEEIRRGAYVPSESPGLVIRGRSTSLAESARRVAAGGDLLTAVRDFLDQAAHRTDDEVAGLIAERPGTTGDERGDVMLAGIAEHLAATRGLRCPAWVLEPERFLDRFWFVSQVPGFRAIALAQTPMALKRRGILWPARSLERV